MDEKEVQETLKKIQDDYNNGRAIILALGTLKSDIQELDTRLTAIEKEVKKLKKGKQ